MDLSLSSFHVAPSLHCWALFHKSALLFSRTWDFLAGLLLFALSSYGLLPSIIVVIHCTHPHRYARSEKGRGARRGAGARAVGWKFLRGTSYSMCTACVSEARRCACACIGSYSNEMFKRTNLINWTASRARCIRFKAGSSRPLLCV